MAWDFVCRQQHHEEIPIQQMYVALRTLDPYITLAEVEWVLGKNDRSDPKNSKIAFDDVYNAVKDVHHGEGLDPVEHAFKLLSHGGYLDLEQVCKVFTANGVEGVTIPMLSMTIQQLRKKQGEQGRKVASGDVDVDVFRRLLQSALKDTGAITQSDSRRSNVTHHV